VPATLRVDVIAQTVVNHVVMTEATNGRWNMNADTGTGAEALAEFAGRACYQSFSRPNPATVLNKDYLNHILEEKHTSVLRHGAVTLYIQGISRNCSHELIRHHIGTDYSQLSQRFVDSGKMDYVVPPAIRGNTRLEIRLARVWAAALEEYGVSVLDLEAEGKTRKQAREAARAFLPGCAETKIVMSGDMHAWRNFIQQRATLHADAEIRELAVEIAWTMREGFPNIFQDMHLETDLKTGVSVVVWD
jgi:thymidylate synthase (FAD)